MAKKVKVKKTPAQKLKKAGIVLLIIALVIALIAGTVAVVNRVTTRAEREFVSGAVTQSAYDSQLVPELAEDGYYSFTCDRAFKILHLTDIHIGAGVMCTQNDISALNAVAAMVTEEKPDLVVVTGDISYPIPFQAGTVNNKPSAALFADMMERLGVYWCNVYGNHDTELYSLYGGRALGKAVYCHKDKYPHCLFQLGPKDIDGTTNYVVNVRNSAGTITQSLFLLDSHSYADGDVFGLNWLYDCVHENQVSWYKDTVKKLTEENGGVTPKSLMFFHIPPLEMKEACAEYVAAGKQDTENVRYVNGVLGESDALVCSGKENYGLFDAAKENGTQGLFFGHDHLNNISLDYKGVRLTYGLSIDYLAYPGITKYGLQRGCTVITVQPDGSFDNYQENYYQDKYKSINPKEEVILDHGMSDDVEDAGAVFDFQAENNKN